MSGGRRRQQGCVLAFEHSLMVEACHFMPPWAVGTRSAVKLAAIVRNESPPALASMMRLTTRGSTEGRPSRTP
jgi:hypothetical protein